ncbi:MAG: metallophosphoesterase [Ruminococcaceae bacterium]|nr:metallophosphoesterase [Oscillospiraceae bacterium]
MNVLIFSDSHRRTDKMCEIISKSPGTDLIIHLGDNLEDAKVLRETFPNIPVTYVAGNCDWPSPDEPNELVLDLEGFRVLIMHGHLRNVKSTYSFMLNVARQKKAHIVIFGHTHTPVDMFDDEIKMFNPGSISRPHCGERASFGTLTIRGGQYLTNISYI